MTNRTTTNDYRVSVSTSCGVVSAGSYFHKVQSGGDYPSSFTPYAKIPYSWANTKNQVDNAIARVDYIARKKKPAKRFLTEPHAYTTSGARFLDPLMNWTWDTFPGPRTGTVAGCFGTPSFTDTWTNNDYIALCGKLRQSILGSDFHAGNFIAEGHQALEMIANSATRIYQSYKALRKGNIQKAARHLTNASFKGKKLPSTGNARQDLANNWLELQYGWLPLLSDAHTGAQALGNVMGKSLQQTYSAQSRKEATVILPAGVAFSVAMGFTRYRIKARVREVNFPSLFGLMDPLGVAWEITPFSFVADWFIPISGFLEARMMNNSVTAVYIHSKLFRTQASGVTLYGGYHGSSGYRSETFIFNRMITTDLNVPLPNFKPLSAVPSWKRAANAVALVSQLFK